MDSADHSKTLFRMENHFVKEFVTIFSSASGRIFRISRFIPDVICSNKAQSTREIELFLVW